MLALFAVAAQWAWLTPARGASAAPNSGADEAPVAAPLAASAPTVSLALPAEAFIGDTVNFTVTFDNADPADPGYGPLIDLVLPTSGPDGAPSPDGLTFVDATYLGTSVERTIITVPGSGTVTHPYMVDSSGSFITVSGLTPGDTFVALRLPFGSFTPGQPPAVVDVTATMSNLADLGTPLTVQARGGYQFGYTPLNDFCCGDNPNLTFSGWTNDSVTPTLFTLEKTYSGPEDETATGPNFPRQYTVTAEIAPGQSLTAFSMTDTLPDNMQFTSLIGTSPAAACSHSNPAVPGGTLTCTYGAVSGTVTMTFEYYIPLRDASSASVIDPASGDDVNSCNNAGGGGTWTPLDGRDAGGAQTVNDAGCEHVLTDKSIATQKSVTVVGGGDPAPGRVLEYTLDVQVSDFFVFRNLAITDVFSDGQRFDASFVPTMTVNGNSYVLASAGMNAANVDVDCNYTGAVASPPSPPGSCDSLDPAANDGSTTIVFNISDEIISRGQDGRMVGGCVPTGGTGGGDPDCGLYDDGSTTAQIVFRTIIQDQFSDDYPSGDPSVDQGDELINNENVLGDILSVTDAATPTGQGEADGSGASVVIGHGSLAKSIYAVNGNTVLPSPVEVKPGDAVTYRLTYTLPTGDVENLALNDYLPMPVFDVADPDANGAPGPAWTFDPTVSPAVPATGVVKFGPSDTFYAYSSVTPALSAFAVDNRLTFTYGNYDGPTEQPYTVDLLFTVTVAADPFADRLYLTNQANASEGSTNSGTSEADAIVQIVLAEPVLVHTKGIVATDNPNATFSPPTVGPVVFNAPGTIGARWGGVIDSPGLAATPVDSNITGVDAGDLVTFAIVIENQGSSPNGAFDITISDIIPPMYQIPSGGAGLNLRISNGDNSSTFTYTDLGGGLFGSGIRIDDPGPTTGAGQAHTVGNGRNIIIITYDLEVRSTVTPGTQINTATLEGYAGTDGGPNHIPPGGEPTDDASSTVLADIAKQLVSTSVSNAYNSNTQAVIGELVTYTLTSTVQEGQIPNAVIVDQLDGGLAFVSCTSVTASSGDVTTDLAGGFGGICATTAASGVTNNGATVEFNLGTLINANRDNSVVETVSITYTAVVLNSVGNQSGTLLNNDAEFFMNGSGGTSLGVSSAPAVTVIEPQVNTAKSVLPATADAGDTVTYTVTLTNPAANSTTAYDVSWSDTLDVNLTYQAGTLALGACAVAVPPTLNDAGAPTLTASGGQLEPGQSCQITFQAAVGYGVSPGGTVPNTATTQWTSLPGVVNDVSSYNPDSDERTGTGAPAQNDYSSTGTVNLAVQNVAPVKHLLSTSEAHTGTVVATQRVAVGEIVRYRLVVQLPEGTSVNFQMQDVLPAGLTFLNDNTAKAVFVSTGGIASANVGGLPVPGIVDSDCQIVGNAADGTNPAIPANCDPLADNNVGSNNSIAADADAFANGTDPFFKLGSLSNNDSDSDAEYVVLEFNALVNNTVGGSNDAGDNRNNTFNVFINGVQNGGPSNTVTVIVAEPSLTLLKTAAIDPSQDAGDTVTYTLTITAAAGINASTAFDLSLTDAFDANLTGLSVTGVAPTQGATCVGNGAGTTAFAHNGGAFAGNNLTFTATCLDPGQSIVVTVQGTVAPTANAGATIPNTANLVWTSLPGTGTTPNPTGSTTPGGSGTDNGERDGSGGQDDYTTNSSAPLALSAPAVDKRDPSPTQYAIGEQIIFDILVTLPEGVTPALQVVDDLPVGLEYVSHQVITSAASSGGLLAADYNGVLAAPTVTAPGGSGGDLTLDFGNTTTDDDNVANNNAFLVRVVARMLNIAGNQNGTALTNTATTSWTGGSVTDSTNISVIEPLLNLVKTADDSAWVYGQTVTFTISVENLAANGSAATAHDVVVTDTIPAGLTYVPASITASAGCVANDAGAPNLSWTCASITLGSAATLTYQVTVNSPPTPPFLSGNDTAVNTASGNWTSQSGNNNPGSPTGERDGTGGVNDYTDNSSHTGQLDAYYAIGNRVWFDTNNNSQIDAGEVGVNNVIVDLYAADGSGAPTGPILATDTTSGGGYYLFDYLTPGDYVVVIRDTNFASGGQLEGYWSSATARLDNGTLSETAAPDADNDADSDDNGTLQNGGAFNGFVISSAVTLGGAEPINEGDLDGGSQGDQPDNRANMTVDFGFYTTSLGDLVYRDDNANGTYDAGDVTLNGVTVELLSGDGTAVLDTTTTNGAGVYDFSGLPAGNYVLRVTTPSGLVSTIDTFDSADNADADTNTDDNDNGIGTGPATAVNVTSSQVTMTPGSAGAASNNTVNNAAGSTDNPTLDFGFIYPYALGNRVWFDTNNNSLIDAGEVGVNGVVVDLYAADGAGNPVGPIIATDTTANGGYYLFDNLLAGDYVVVLPASNFASGGALYGYWSSATTMGPAGAITETQAPDPDLGPDNAAGGGDDDFDSDDNGTLQGGVVLSRAVTLGPGGLTEPTGETDLDGGSQGTQPDGRANMTVDFGFYRVEVGNVVFTDLNNDGAYNGADTPIANARVRLYASDGATEILVGLDGILGTGDDAAGGMFTNVTGNYLFANLPAGNYIVSVEAPVGYSSTIDTFDAADNASPNTNTDNNDNGVGVGAGEVFSSVVNLVAGSAGAQNNNTVTNANGTTTNPTVDFGFITTLYSLGNRVWFDTNNNSQIDAGEAPINGVVVELYAADLAGNPIAPALASDTTANGGYYIFDNLGAGNYIVVVAASNFAPGGVLNGYWSSATTMGVGGTTSETAAPDGDDDVDSDDNGTLNLFGGLPGAVASLPVTLGPGNIEPAGETDLEAGVGQGSVPDLRGNMTVDFGFYRVELGNLVFVDADNNGAYNAGDTPLPGAIVQLYSSNGTEIPVGPDGILGTADDAPGGMTTGAGGTYEFSGLAEGGYIVRVTPPVGYTSTVDTSDNADTTDPDTNTDNNDNGVGVGVGQASSNAVTLTPGSAGAASNNTVNNGNGTTTNPTVDFGFVGNNGAISKSLIGTIMMDNGPLPGVDATTTPDVAIGEILTYEVVVNLPVGTPLTNVTVTDQMDKGLAFVGCDIVEVAGVDQTATVCPPAVSSITDPGDLPGNPANPGRQVVFTIGNIPAQAAATTLRIQYRAIVLDVIENQQGVTLNNNATWAFDGGSFSASAPNVEIQEPDLTIDKSATPSSGVAIGTPILFTITIGHSALSATDAYDVVVTDILPPELQYIPCTVTYVSGLPPTSPVAPAYCPGATSNLVFVWDTFPLGATSTITFNAQLVGTPATNSSNVAWTSLPIDPQPGGLPVELSPYNSESTERWYDPFDDVNIYAVSDSVTINPVSGGDGDADADADASAKLPARLPDTGFAPNRVTILPDQPVEKAYRSTDVWIEVPRLGVKMPIVGVPIYKDEWDVSWLWNEAGWLEGTAFPTWSGNSVLTGHVTLPNGEDGPFAALGKLKYGDRVYVHAYGMVYIYEVRQNRVVGPGSIGVFKHEEESWLTLLTCKDYVESTDSYSSRIAVRAVLIRTMEEPASGKDERR
ncbi:MAG: hypothetical protein KPEEDBHJ_02836 [Anaerolineales bacterium]|nr:hypothetical protein [Anaerolineales bacterium]